MSEIKRTKEVISREYANLATRVGHANYQIHTLQKDIELHLSTMRDLNLEAAAAENAEKQAAAAAAKESPNA